VNYKIKVHEDFISFTATLDSKGRVTIPRFLRKPKIEILIYKRKQLEDDLHARIQ
jgi:bifunctional DNA-binding transcriptional regulator/antitoxin component of YhaV-PrlF toxin-antitoxin module